MGRIQSGIDRKEHSRRQDNEWDKAGRRKHQSEKNKVKDPIKRWFFIVDYMLKIGTLVECVIITSDLNRFVRFAPFIMLPSTILAGIAALLHHKLPQKVRTNFVGVTIFDVNPMVTFIMILAINVFVLYAFCRGYI